jgi:hypothetical protein
LARARALEENEAHHREILVDLALDESRRRRRAHARRLLRRLGNRNAEPF